MSPRRKGSVFTEEEAAKNRVAIAFMIGVVLVIGFIIIFVGLQS